MESNQTKAVPVKKQRQLSRLLNSGENNEQRSWKMSSALQVDACELSEVGSGKQDKHSVFYSKI